MRAIINGFRYDTDRARLLGEGGSLAVPYSDFRWWEAGLYVTPRAGRYFLAGEGGPMTRFAQRVGDMRGYGERIIPMTAEEALEWAQRFLTTEEVESAFGDSVEDA